VGTRVNYPGVPIDDFAAYEHLDQLVQYGLQILQGDGHAAATEGRFSRDFSRSEVDRTGQVWILFQFAD
jgi:hypothetical protein